MAEARSIDLKIAYTAKANMPSTSARSDSTSATETTGGTGYTIKNGDTLWGLAVSNYGKGKGQKYTVIYNANKDVIESTAKAHGRSNSDNGHWIYPGTVINIPALSEDSTSTSNTISSGTSGVSSVLSNLIKSNLQSITYTDIASGSSDSISLEMNDLDMDWINKYMPEKGAGVDIGIILKNWFSEGSRSTLECGSFFVDDISFSGRPLNCVLGGVSVPAEEGFKSHKKSKTWTKVTIKEIGSEIAKAAGVKLYYEAPSIQIKEVEQSKETDSSFLYSLCKKYGLAMKVYKNKIVIFDEAVYEAKKAIVTIDEKDMISWSYNTTVDGTYTGARLSYTNPDTKKTIEVIVGNTGRLLDVNSQVDSQKDAELQAAASVNDANKKIDTMEITMPGNTSIIASSVISITGLGKINGNYYVDQVKHNITGIYKMNLSLHKIQQKFTKAVEPAVTSGNYVVKSGDTLWAIAKKYYGSGIKYTIIYNANKDIIESVAKSHGRSNSDNGHWIYPGTSLTIPSEG